MPPRPIPSLEYIHTAGRHFKDSRGRTLLLRGVNLAASAKTPVGQPSEKLEGFFEAGESGEMTFVNRVLRLDNDTIDVHLSRLRLWGFNVIRYVTNWESIEHAGPGKYDDAYIAYTIAVLRKLQAYGFRVFIDPHQDTFSRFSGGSGAPLWAIHACGMEPRAFTRTGAAVIQCEWPDPDAPDPASVPSMIWATNYSRLACQTIFTMFFAGRHYAHRCIIDGVNIQDYLQRHFIGAYAHLAAALAAAGDLLDSCVIGWDSINEPNQGFIDCTDLRRFAAESVLKVGPMPTPFEGLLLGMGHARTVEHWRCTSLGPKRDGSQYIDPRGACAWLDPSAEPGGQSRWGWKRDPAWRLGTCVWAQHGVWDTETQRILRPDYFRWYRDDNACEVVGTLAHFAQDFWLPHWEAYAAAIRTHHPDAILFTHSPVFQVPPKISRARAAKRAVYSTHFYDGLTLVTRHWNWFNVNALDVLRGKFLLFAIRIGERAIKRCMQVQLRTLRADSFHALGDAPTLIGELGIPMDLDNAQPYKDGDYSNQIRALDATLNACDGRNVLNYCIWTYTPDNTHYWGDRWNGEDLSIWSYHDLHRMKIHAENSPALDLKGRINPSRRAAEERFNTLGHGRGRDIEAGTPEPVDRADRTASGPLAGSTQRLSSTKNSSFSKLIPVGNGSSNKLNPVSNSSANKSSTANNNSTGKLRPTSPGNNSFTSKFDPTKSTPLSFDTIPDIANPAAYEPNHINLEEFTQRFSLLNLNDGARALSAFCRPFPVATVGTPFEINFDIPSSVFTLTVLVSPKDTVVGEECHTEIYVPLVHYAAYPRRVFFDDDEEDATQDDAAVKGAAPEDASRKDTPDFSPSPDSPNTSHTIHRTSSKESIQSANSNRSTRFIAQNSTRLSLDVTVSHGSYYVIGQTLFWKYQLPTRTSEYYKIEIKRKHGPIPKWVHEWDGNRAGHPPTNKFPSCVTM